MDAGGKGGGVKSDINVTPLVDIVLVLLIIFIVITPAVNDSVKLPIAKHSPKVDKTPGDKYMTLYMGAKRDSNGKVIGTTPVTTDDSAVPKDLRFNLDDEKSALMLSDYINQNVSALQGEKKVFVKADSELPFKEVNKLFQLARKAGAEEASIVTGEEKKKEEGGN
ncbi:MAG TPA: biopolymer transporter ExbD [Holophagaceae bacterium]|nr:biopolymer transporter ExbD [Holophagaceae bacterium]